MNPNKTMFRSSVLGALPALGATVPLYAASQSAASLPNKPTHGSTQVGKCESESKLAKLVTVEPAQAIEAATSYTRGPITEIKLEAENRLLVWPSEIRRQ